MTLEQALIEAMTEAGYVHITVEFVRTDIHSIRWTRSLDTIAFKLPKDIEALPDEASAELVGKLAAAIRWGEHREMSPSLILAMRETTGWPLPAFDAEGHRITGEVTE